MYLANNWKKNLNITLSYSVHYLWWSWSILGRGRKIPRYQGIKEDLFSFFFRFSRKMALFFSFFAKNQNAKNMGAIVMRQVNLALIWKPQIVNDFASLINPVCNIIVLCTFLGSLDLLVVGFCLTWRYPLNFVAVVAICCWLLQLFGSSSTTLVLFVVVIMVVLFLFQDVDDDIFTGEEKKQLSRYRWPK